MRAARSQAVAARVRGRLDLVALAIVGAKSADEIELEQKINTLSDKRYGTHDTATLKKLFMSYDADKDGLLNKGEISALYSDADVGSWLTRGAWVDGTFKKVDKNTDGKLSWEEYVVASDLAKASPTTTPGTPAAPTTTTSPGYGVGENCDPKTGLCYGASEQAGFPVLPVLVGVVAVGLVVSTLSIGGS